MPEAWEIAPSDERPLNQVTVFIIFCEDQNDEPYYFRSFQLENKVKINCIPNQRNTKANLLNALTWCSNEGFIEYENHTFKVKADTPENIWSVYDRDLEHEDFQKNNPVDDSDFTAAITMSLQAGIKVAWSNDAFELWILLHFEKVPVGQKLHRNFVYDRLTEIVKGFGSVQAAYKEIIDNGRFNYKVHMKRRLAFLAYILPVIKDRTLTAIENAAALEGIYSTAVPYHDCNPCTKVHHLVNDIMKAQA